MELLAVFALYLLLALMQTQDQLGPYAIPGAAGSCSGTRVLSRLSDWHVSGCFV